MADDRERFERIYRENFRAVLRFAAARIDADRARDVAAETFLVAWRRLDDVPAEARPWLLGVARRVIAGQFRSETRRDALAARLRSVQARDARPADPAAALGDRDEVLAAFAALGERDREVLRLVAWDGLDAGEAADVLGISRLAFAVRLHRARQRLRRALEPEPLPPAPQKTRRRHVDAHS
jgi:RNA polymerase sigma factor (sigma-70 family)